MAETTLMKFIDRVIIIIEENKSKTAEGRLPEMRRLGKGLEKQWEWLRLTYHTHE